MLARAWVPASHRRRGGRRLAGAARRSGREVCFFRGPTRTDDGPRLSGRHVPAEFLEDGRYIYQTRQGVSAARNRGLEMAAGEWLAFLDSDDFWLPRKLETQVDFLNRNPQAEICQTEEIWVRHGRRVNPRKKHRKPSGDIFAPSLALCLVSPSAVMLKKSLFLEVGVFDTSLPACEDYDLWLRISCRKPVFLIEEPLVVKRGGHPDQLSRCLPSLDRYRIQSLGKLLDSGRLSPRQYDLAWRELDRKCRIYGQGCLKRGKIEEGKRYLSLPARWIDH